MLYYYQVGGPVHAAPAIADLDGDNYLEIIFSSSTNKSVYCIYGLNNSLKWNYTGSGNIYNVVVGDVDNDDEEEVLFGSSGKLFCLAGKSGIEKWNYTSAGAIQAC